MPAFLIICTKLYLQFLICLCIHCALAYTHTHTPLLQETANALRCGSGAGRRAFRHNFDFYLHCAPAWFYPSSLKTNFPGTSIQPAAWPQTESSSTSWRIKRPDTMMFINLGRVFAERAFLSPSIALLCIHSLTVLLSSLVKNTVLHATVYSARGHRAAPPRHVPCTRVCDSLPPVQGLTPGTACLQSFIHTSHCLSHCAE